MAARDKGAADTGEAWLLDAEGDPADGPTHGGKRGGRETSQWLAIPSPEERKVAPSPLDADLDADEPAQRKRRPRGIGALFSSPRERMLAGRLRRAQEQIDAQAAEITALQDRIESLEHSLQKRRAAKAKPKTASKQPASNKSASKNGAGGRPAPPKGKRNLNTIGFDELRELGLTIQQSARVVAYRETVGGFKSFDELLEVPGLSETRATELRDRLRGSSS